MSLVYYGYMYDLLAQTGSLWDQFGQSFAALGLILKYIPYWGPPVLLVTFWRLWMRYVRARFIEAQDYTLLEIRLPAEVMKSPLAMTAVFEGLWAKGGESTFIDRMWLGKVRLWYSFELVSHEGQVRLYVWVRSAFRRMVERMFYAHYPDVELVEADDYALQFPFSLDSHNLYGIDYKLKGATGLPIKTFVEYNLDQTQPKEEQKTDPMAHLLEFLGSMGKGEHLWIQLICRAHKAEDVTFGAYYTKKTYTELAQEKISSIRSKPEETVVFPDGSTGKQLSEKQKDEIKAITRNMQRTAVWEVGARCLYIAEHEYFDGPTIPGMQALWQPFGMPGYNAIVPVGNRWQNVLDYPWQDFNGLRENRMKVKHVDAYRRRSWFHAPYVYRPMLLTSEELATLYHLPGTVAKTPSVQRIESLRAQAPSNLPV